MEKEALSTDSSAEPASLSSTPDLDLARRHRYGDDSAFEEVYRQYSPLVYNLCLRMVRHPQEAEDLAQDVFLRIHRHLGKFDGRSALKTWIYRVTLNYCRSQLGRKKWSIRRAMRSIAGEDEESGVQLEETGRSPEERAVASDQGRFVLAALDEVKPTFREAVILRDLEGLSYDEIAEVLKIRIGTVRSRISRGRRQLREVLEAKEPDQPS